MLGLEPSDLGFKYKIEIASGQLVEIDKVIKGCKLEIEGHIFDIDLIPFGHGSFDVIIGMDWLSIFKAKIIYHEKVVRIPLPDGKVLRVVRERSDEKARLLMSAKASDKKPEEIVMVRDFLEVFLDDQSGLPPIREIEFRIELTSGATPVAKYPYRLSPSKLEELSGKLKELQDKGFIRPSSSPCGASIEALFKNWNSTLEISTEVRLVLRIGLGVRLGSRYDGHMALAAYLQPEGSNMEWFVIVDQLTKFAHFLPMREDYKMEMLSRLYLNEIVARHGVPISIISDQDSRFTSRFWQLMQEALETRLDMNFGGSWDVHLPLVEFSYNNSYHSSMRCAPFEALYGRKCHSLILWVEVGECVVRFGKKGKLVPRFVGPFEIIEKVGPVSYRLDLPEELNGVHDTFHVSNLKKCLANPTLKVPLDEIQINDKLNFVEEPIEILEREFKKLKRSRIANVKVRWNSKRGPEFTWEREDQMKLKYPHLFSDVGI
ncbi:putative reverse transcriptase domain-containing protein [Tanacetum coccineum]